MKSFFKEALSTIKTSGTIKPSSKYLIDNCLKDINFKEAKTILQFGSGEGCFTAELLSRMSEHTELFTYEINSQFYTHCANRFLPQDNLHLLNSSALEFEEVLNKECINKVDCIVSTLPLALFKNTEVKNLLNKVYKYLNKNGVYIQYQYSLKSYRELKKTFDKVDLSFTLMNVPPAFVYTCYKK
ncbi:class I SAM-dependent methyltransferase [Kordia sp.]|uniref:class I SAM-dependent methyltransferase n=1 Tax=Kordia sp. TaxID=1965332 RepID=UPI003D6AF582